MSKLKECPFCENIPDPTDTRISMFAFGVTCRVCGAAGPLHTVPNDNPDHLTMNEMDIQLAQRATDSWNDRRKK